MPGKKRGPKALSSSWTEDQVDMLGKVPDQQAADALGVSIGTIYNERRRRGIPSNRVWKKTCSKCSAPSAVTPCPYDDDVNDKATPCNCCDNCRRDCARDI